MSALVRFFSNHKSNFEAIAEIVRERCQFTRMPISSSPVNSPEPAVWPDLDISVVTFNSEQWLDSFVDSLLKVDYPKRLLTIRFVDIGSEDGTETALRSVIPKLHVHGIKAYLISRYDRCYGAGHNTAIRAGCAPFCLVTKIELVLEADSLRRVVAMAASDAKNASAWELRQKPFEQPKFYDPITGSTNWNSHACILLRRSAVEAVGYYDENLSMYGVDVELSYRLRRAGYLLRYCVVAVVWDFAQKNSDQTELLRFIGLKYANLYLRLKYGNLRDICSIPAMVLALLIAPTAFPRAKSEVARELVRLIKITPQILKSRSKSSVHFPFRYWNYEMIRDDMFHEQRPLLDDQPLVSIITRTYHGRDLYLRQALVSGAHQTWRNVEHIVVQDGGDSMRQLCEEVASATGHVIRFIANGKHGRAAAGNKGLAVARGHWCVFLDDDDMLFQDHIEVLANSLIDDVDAVASYTLAWEVPTDSALPLKGCYVEQAHQVVPAHRQPFDFDRLQRQNYIPIQSLLFERRLFEERGGFYEDLNILEDWALWVRWAWNNRFVYVPKVTSLYRTPGNASERQRRQEAFDQAFPIASARIDLAIRQLQAEN